MTFSVKILKNIEHKKWWHNEIDLIARMLFNWAHEMITGLGLLGHK